MLAGMTPIVSNNAKPAELFHFAAGDYENDANASTYSDTVDMGTENAGKLGFITFFGDGGASGLTDVTITGATPVQVIYGGDADEGYGIYSFIIPPSGIVSWSISFGGNKSNFTARILYAENVKNTTASYTGGGKGILSLSDVNIPKDGFAICAAMDQSGGTSFTWTGATKLGTDLNLASATLGTAVAGGEVVAGTISVSANAEAMFVASFR